jgi:hypothetical protein
MSDRSRDLSYAWERYREAVESQDAALDAMLAAKNLADFDAAWRCWTQAVLLRKLRMERVVELIERGP